MKNLVIGIFLGLFLGTLITAAIAKYESSSSDAASVVGYGNYSGAIVQLKVSSDGTLQIK